MWLFAIKLFNQAQAHMFMTVLLSVTILLVTPKISLFPLFYKTDTPFFINQLDLETTLILSAYCMVQILKC